MKWLTPLFGLVLAGVLPGCERPVSRSDVLGTYQANYGFATETLLIHNDGHFIQTIKVKSDGKLAVTNGTWKIDTEDREIIFDKNFMIVQDGFGKFIPSFDQPNRERIVILPVRRMLRHVQIGVHPRTPYKWQAGETKS